MSYFKLISNRVIEPASFSDSYEALGNVYNKQPNEKHSTYVKYVNEYDDLKLKCKAKGKPKPSITWILKYTNGTANRIQLFNSLHLFNNNDTNLIHFGNFFA